MKYSQRVKNLEKRASVDQKPPVVVGFYPENYEGYFTYNGKRYPMEQLVEFREAGYPILGIHTVGDDAEELKRIWRDQMNIEPGSESWEWRVQTYIRDKGLST